MEKRREHLKGSARVKLGFDSGADEPSFTSYLLL
jgi:hypothetical protein